MWFGITNLATCCIADHAPFNVKLIKDQDGVLSMTDPRQNIELPDTETFFEDGDETMYFFSNECWNLSQVHSPFQQRRQNGLNCTNLVHL